MNEEKNKPGYCIKRVWEPGMWMTSYQCQRKGTVTEENGDLHCKIHSLAYKAEKDAKSDEKYKKDSCSKCQYHFDHAWYGYCPICGTQKGKIK